jgi:SPP1 gp7 family putative phage head morphogenesis protein
VKLKALHPSAKIEKRLRDSIDRHIKLMLAELEPIANSNAPMKDKYDKLWKAADKWEGIFEQLGRDEGTQLFKSSFDKSHQQLIEQLVAKMKVNPDIQFEDEAFAKLMDNSITEATSLIRSIPKKYMGEVEKALLTYEKQQPLPEGRSLWEQIQHTGGVTRWRAQFLARDQTSKLNAAVTQFQYEQAGIKEYIWRTAGDSRVVGNPSGKYPQGSKLHHDHYHRDGKVYKWSAPGPKPGEEINCRCVALPVLDKGRLSRK